MRTVLFVDEAVELNDPHTKGHCDRVACIEIMCGMTEAHFDPRIMELFLPISMEVRTNG